MTATLFTSDLHIGHRMMAGLRGCGEDAERHDAMLADAWDSVVTKRDLVWVLGDLCMSNPARALEWINARPGRKRLILGNHDYGHPMYRDSPKWLPRYAEAFEYVAPFARTRISGTDVLLSHFPYTTDRGFEARFPQWRLPNMGGVLLHGHTHSAEKITSPTEVHVGVDAWGYTPVQAHVAAALLT